MALRKQTVAVDVTGGLVTGDDDFASVGLARLRDARWRLGKQIGKRNGCVDIESTGLPASTVDRNAVVDVDGLPHVLTNDGAFRLDSQTNEWRPLCDGAPIPSRVVTSPLARPNDALIKPDCAVVGTLLCTTWQNAETKLGFYAFHDVSLDTPRLVSGPHTFAAGNDAGINDRIRVIAIGSSFVAVGRIDDGSTSDLMVQRYDLSAADYTFGASALVRTNTESSGGVVLEKSATESHYYVAFRDGGVGRVRRYTAAGASTGSILALSVVPTCMIHNGPLAKVVLLAADGSMVYAAEDLSGVNTVVTAFSDPPSGTFTGAFERSAICLADDAGSMWCARSTLGSNRYSSSDPCGVQFVHVDTTFAVFSGDNVVSGQVLMGQALYTSIIGPVFTVADQFTPATTAVVSSVAPGLKAAPVGYYVAPILRTVDTVERADYVSCGRWCQDTLFGWEVGPHLAHLCLDYADQAVSTTTQRTYQAQSVGESSSSLITAGTKVDLVASAFARADPARSVTAQGLRLLGHGSGCTMIDGGQFAENTPPCPGYLYNFEFDAAITEVNNVDNFDIVEGANFLIIWRWYDEKGNIHRGAPSSPRQMVTRTEFDGLAYHPAKLCFPKYYPTGMLGDRYVRPEVEVYCYPNATVGAEYRLLAVVPPEDNPTNESESYVAIVASTITSPAIVPRHVVYATLGIWEASSITPYSDNEVDSWPSPPLLDIVSTGGRLWGLSGEGARLEVWYTKPIAIGFAPEWSPLFTVSIPQEGGDCVALAALDDKVVALKRRQIFVITGDPGDANGDGSSLQRPRLVSGDVGCVNVNSVVQGPFGVAFQSERGWFTLSRSLELTFIGDAMQAAFDADWSVASVQIPYVEASVVVPAENEVRWAVSQSRGNADALCAVWNYQHNKWAVSTAFDARSFCVSDGVAIRLGYSSLTRETPDDWSGIASATQEVVFPWLALAGLAGFQRLWRVVLTLRWYSGDIYVQTSTDYQTTTETLKTWSAATLATLVDSGTHLLQLDVRPTVQRCESLRVALYGFHANATGRGFELVGCQLEIGTKTGAFKALAAAAKG